MGVRVPAAAAGSAQLAGELLSNETGISVSRHCRGESCRRPCYAKESGQRGIQSKINTRTRARGELVEPPPSWELRVHVSGNQCAASCVSYQPK